MKRILLFCSILVVVACDTQDGHDCCDGETIFYFTANGKITDKSDNSAIENATVNFSRKDSKSDNYRPLGRTSSSSDGNYGIEGWYYPNDTIFVHLQATHDLYATNNIDTFFLRTEFSVGEGCEHESFAHKNINIKMEKR